MKNQEETFEKDSLKHSENEWKVIKTFTYPHMAQLIKTKLESEGMECRLYGEQTSNTIPISALQESIGARLLVKESDVAKALQIMKELEAKNFCPTCNKEIENNYCDTCKKERKTEDHTPWKPTVMGLLMIFSLFPLFGVPLALMGIFQKKRRLQGVVLLLITALSIVFIFDYGFYVTKEVKINSPMYEKLIYHTRFGVIKKVDIYKDNTKFLHVQYQSDDSFNVVMFTSNGIVESLHVIKDMQYSKLETYHLNGMVKERIEVYKTQYEVQEKIFNPHGELQEVGVFPIERFEQMMKPNLDQLKSLTRQELKKFL